MSGSPVVANSVGNPYNNEAVAQLGMRTAFSGRWDGGYEIALRAISQSPAPASWCHWVPALNHYVKRDYETARAFAEKSRLQEIALLGATRAMIYGLLNMKQKAAKALANCRRLGFKFDKRARQWFAVHQLIPKVLDHFMEGLVKAGLGNQTPSN